MNTLFIPVFLFSFIASAVFAQNSTFTINTPANLVQCEPVLLTWIGGASPFYLSILPAGQPSATALVSFVPMNGSSYTWNVNITHGADIFFNLRDSTGALAQSGSDVIQANPSQDSSCINASAVVPIPSVSSSVVPTTTSLSGSTSAAGISVPGATGGSSTQGSSSTSTGAKTSPSNAAAASHYAPVGTLAMTGVALAFALVL